MAEGNSYPVWPGWETVRMIGRGSFGAVYEISRDYYGLKEKAALKEISIPQTEGEIDELRSDGLDDESIRSTFTDQLQSILQEYSMMRKLNGNTNVVNCDDVLVADHEDGIGKTILIKMELLTPMTKAVFSESAEETAIRLGIEMCNALKLCESESIIHRDIKPANIFLSDKGAFKLGDFGVSRTMQRTTGGTKTGTPDYMAPEVYYGRKYNHTVDIYSLGIVLYWLLNNRRTPFLPQPPVVPKLSDKDYARERRLRGEEIPAPISGSEELKRIVLKACAYAPADRYPTAAAMLSDLEKMGFPSSNSENATSYAQQDTHLPVDIQMPQMKTETSETEAQDDETVGVFKKPEPLETARTDGAAFQTEAANHRSKKKCRWFVVVMASILVGALLVAFAVIGSKGGYISINTIIAVIRINRIKTTRLLNEDGDLEEYDENNVCVKITRTDGSMRYIVYKKDEANNTCKEIIYSFYGSDYAKIVKYYDDISHSYDSLIRAEHYNSYGKLLRYYTVTFSGYMQTEVCYDPDGTITHYFYTQYDYYGNEINSWSETADAS